MIFYVATTVSACYTGGSNYYPKNTPAYNDGDSDPPNSPVGDVYRDNIRVARRDRTTSQGHVYVRATVYPLQQGGHYWAHNISSYGMAKMMGNYTFIKPGGDYITKPISMQVKGSVVSAAHYKLCANSSDGIAKVNFYDHTLPNGTDVQGASPILENGSSLEGDIPLSISSPSWTNMTPDHTFDLNRISATAYAETGLGGQDEVYAEGTHQVSSWVLNFGSPNY